MTMKNLKSAVIGSFAIALERLKSGVCDAASAALAKARGES